jgi:hypothetical protein
LSDFRAIAAFYAFREEDNGESCSYQIPNKRLIDPPIEVASR